MKRSFINIFERKGAAERTCVAERKGAAERKGFAMKPFAGFAAAAVLLASCEEWEPVYTLKYDDPANYERVTMTPTHTIAQLASLYEIGTPKSFTDDIIVAGKVSSSDESGNFYKSFYIQDETGGIEVKIGRSSLYSDYKEGQTVYVNLSGLTIGMYGFKTYKEYADGPSGGNGLVQIGLEDPTNEYETSYIEVESIINNHIFRGADGPKVTPVVLTEKELPGRNATLKDCPSLGKLVTIKGLKYSNKIFTLAYIDSNLDKKSSSNRIFLSDQTWGIDTWAMSKNLFVQKLDEGLFDSVKIGNSGDYNYGTVADHKDVIRRNAAAATVSQYFTCGGTELAIRTSGFAKFSDQQIPAEVLNGTATIDVTGVLSLYQGDIQITINSIDDIVVNK